MSRDSSADTDAYQLSRPFPAPPLHEVVQGLWCIPLALPGSAVGHVLCYAFESQQGVVLVDTGWDDVSALSALEDCLRSGPGVGVKDIVGIVITHGHADHVGLAKRLRQLSGAWIGMHPLDVAMMDERYSDSPAAVAGGLRWLQTLGVPRAAQARYQEAIESIRGRGERLAPDVLLTDGERVPLPGWSIAVQHMPGHTPGHIALVVAESGVVLGGDHILPGISSSVMALRADEGDPLGAYIAAVERAAEGWKNRLVLPGHGHPFRGLEGRAREVLDRTAMRLAEVRSITSDSEWTAWDVAQRVGWSRGWEGRTVKSRRAALGSTLAFLLHLERRGELARTGTQVIRFRSAR